MILNPIKTLVAVGDQAKRRGPGTVGRILLDLSANK
jgi:hypothetical protein